MAAIQPTSLGKLFYKKILHPEKAGDPDSANKSPLEIKKSNTRKKLFAAFAYQQFKEEGKNLADWDGTVSRANCGKRLTQHKLDELLHKGATEYANEHLLGLGESYVFREARHYLPLKDAQTMAGKVAPVVLAGLLPPGVETSWSSIRDEIIENFKNIVAQQIEAHDFSKDMGKVALSAELENGFKGLLKGQGLTKLVLQMKDMNADKLLKINASVEGIEAALLSGKFAFISSEDYRKQIAGIAPSVYAKGVKAFKLLRRRVEMRTGLVLEPEAKRVVEARRELGESPYCYSASHRRRGCSEGQDFSKVPLLSDTPERLVEKKKKEMDALDRKMEASENIYRNKRLPKSKSLVEREFYAPNNMFPFF